MPRPLRLVERDRDLLEALSFRVRLFSLPQVSTGFFADDDSAARRRLKQLSEYRLIETRSVVSRSLPTLDAPLLKWSPGDTKPECGRIAAKLQRRWSIRRTRETTCVLLGKKGAKLFGVSYRSGPRHPLHIAHDLALGTVFIRYLATRPEIASAWVGEDAFTTVSSQTACRGEVVPDAMVVDSERRPRLAIELGGLYSTRRIASIHRSLSGKEIPYEIW